MADAITSNTTKRYAVVTGANKGIGFEICRQLASNGITVVLAARDEKKGLEALDKLKGSGPSNHMVFHQLDVTDSSSIASFADFIKSQFGRLDILGSVVLTARDEKKGLEALDKLKGSGLSDHVVFHQLDVTDSSSIASFADFIKSQYGRLDILVNNAGISGATVDWDSIKTSVAAAAGGGSGSQIKWNEFTTQTYESAKQCLETNYYGAKWMSEALIPLLQLSDSPRIVNVSSGRAKLKNIPSEWAKGVLSDAERLTEERVEELVNEFMKDFEEGSLETKGWPPSISAYTVSKLAMNAYTRILAKNYPNFRINSVCPGYVKTDINNNTGVLSVEEGAESIVRLALLPDDGPSGLFFIRNEVWTD